jgi:hypothetical protein
MTVNPPRACQVNGVTKNDPTRVVSEPPSLVGRFLARSRGTLCPVAGVARMRS